MSGALNGLLGSYKSTILGDYESIQTITLASANATVVFSSIPATYQHLQLRISSRDTRAVVTNDMRIQLNGDTGTNYSFHRLRGENGAVAAAASATIDNIQFSFEPGASAGANIFGGAIVDILDYANVNKFTTVRSFGGSSIGVTASNSMVVMSGNWRNAAAVNSIKVFNGGPATFTANSKFALYGIKG